MLQFVEKLVSGMTHWQLLNVRISHSTQILEKTTTEFYQKKIVFLLWFKCLDLIHAHLSYEKDIEAIWIFLIFRLKICNPAQLISANKNKTPVTSSYTSDNAPFEELCVEENIKKTETKSPKCTNVSMLDLIYRLTRVNFRLR